MTYCNGETSVIRPDLTSPGAYLILFLDESLISKTYLDAAEKRGLLPMFYLELVSGLRKGELTALLWSDLDITNRTISVSKQYVKNPNGELTLSRPKTETSVRKVSVP